MKSDLIVFGEDWGAHPSSTQHLVKHLSQSRKTLWVNSIGMRRPRFSLKDGKRILQKGRALLQKSPPRQRADGPLDVIAPKAIPWPGNPLASLCNRFIFARQLQKKLRLHHMDKPILWTSLPTAIEVMDQFDAKAVVYYCGDDFSALDGVDHAPVTRCEQKLADRADLIITASEKLGQKFPKDKTIVLPHGVDFDLFATAARCPEDCISDRPIAGFYGSLAEWVDVDLIAKAADLLPDWDFMLVGPVKTDVTALHQKSNVRFIPPQPHDRLPGYVQHWDAALLPFKDNDQIRACNPLKLREYLASNTPVVTTDFPALARYRDKVNVFKDAQGLVDILKTLQADPQQSRCVQSESWQKRADEVDNLLSIWDETP